MRCWEEERSNEEQTIPAPPACAVTAPGVSHDLPLRRAERMYVLPLILNLVFPVSRAQLYLKGDRAGPGKSSGAAQSSYST